MSKKICEELKTQNAKIVKFYKEHPSIDFEKANLLLIYLLDTVFNHISNDLDSNINSQILSYLSSTKKDFDNLKENISFISDTVSKMNTDTITNINQQLEAIKKEYVSELRNIVSTTSITTSDKLSTFIEKNNVQLLDKTTLLLNDVIPKTQDVYQSKVRDSIESNIKDLHQKICEDTSKIVNSSSSEKTIQNFLQSFDSKYTSMLQTIQQPLFSYVSASEERITNNINTIKEMSTKSIVSQEDVQDELKQFLSKYIASSNKGKYGENNLFSILTTLFPSSDIQNTTGTKASGDFILKRLDKPTILIENKDYNHNINKEEVSKFIRDIDTQNMNGIFISQYSGITFKNNYHIDIHKGNILVYIQYCEYSPDKIRIATDIIDYLYDKVQELNTGESNNISKEILDDINDEYQTFISQRETTITILKDFQKKMMTQLESIKLPSLDKYLDSKYASTKPNLYSCDICNEFIGSNKQSLSAHKRGCKKRCVQVNEQIST